MRIHRTRHFTSDRLNSICHILLGNLKSACSVSVSVIACNSSRYIFTRGALAFDSVKFKQLIKSLITFRPGDVHTAMSQMATSESEPRKK